MIVRGGEAGSCDERGGKRDMPNKLNNGKGGTSREGSATSDFGPESDRTFELDGFARNSGDLGIANFRGTANGKTLDSTRAEIRG